MQNQIENLPEDDQVLEDVILQQQIQDMEAGRQAQRAMLLRVYNYYRIVVSFILIILFYQSTEQRFVGTLEPEFFQVLAMSYLGISVVFALYCLVAPSKLLHSVGTVAIVTVDMIFLSLIMLTTGGVQSGLGNLLIIPMAFSGVMISGRLSYLVPAIAATACLSSEIYLSLTGTQTHEDAYFQVGLLGGAFFVATVVFRYLSSQVDKREHELVSLEALNKMHEIAGQSRMELEDTVAKLNVLMASTSEGVLGLDLKGRVTFANTTACRLLDINYEDLMGRDIRDFLFVEVGNPDQPVEIVDLRRQKVLEVLGLQETENYAPNYWQTANAQPFLVDYSCEQIFSRHREILGVVLVFQNVTEKKRNEDRLKRLAHLDSLTDLANYRYFSDSLRTSLARAERSGKPLGVMVLELAYPRLATRRVGQSSRDRLLQAIAHRLSVTVRASELAAYLGEDRFAIMLVDLDTPENASLAANRFARVISKPVKVFNKSVDVRADIGIVVAEDQSWQIDNLVKAAISAAGKAKELPGKFCFYQPELQKVAEEKDKIRTLLQSALENEEFYLEYQPIVSLSTSRITACEALIRWKPQTSEAIPPDKFLPVAELSGDIGDIDLWVVETVFEQFSQWRDEFEDGFSIGINVSSKLLLNHNFGAAFEALLNRYQLPADAIEVEIEEAGILEDPMACLEEIRFLRRLGVRIAIDGFGTGHTSLAYLKSLPIDSLKIDPSFIRDVGDSTSEEILEVMVRMAQSMRFKVVCKGVETEQQLAFLKQINCDLVQGFQLSRPLAADEFSAFVTREQNGGFGRFDRDVATVDAHKSP